MQRKLALKPDPVDNRDYSYIEKYAKLKTINIKNYVDLEDEMPEVYDQSYLGSCTANAAIALVEYYYKSTVKPYPKFSRLDLYYWSRDMGGFIHEDDGAYLRDVCKVLQKRGVGLEQHWPYIPEKVFDRPNDITIAVQFASRITEYYRILNQNSMMTALSNGQPVIIGMRLYSNFYDLNDEGIVKMPTSSDFWIGNHAMLIVGYDKERNLVKIRNSWGKNWGVNGYCWVPYEMLYYPYMSDMWTFKYFWSKIGS